MRTHQSTNRSAERMLDILDYVSTGEHASLAEIAQAAQLPKSTTFRLLQTLEERRYLARDESTKRFSLGLKIGALVEGYTGGRFELLRCAATEALRALNQKHNEAVRLFVRDGGFKFCIEAMESTRVVRHVVRIGERSAFSGAAGKVLLAHMPLSERLYFLTDCEQETQIEKIRNDGYAMSIDEGEEGRFELAAPIFTEVGRFVAAVSLSGYAMRFFSGDMEEKIKDTIACGTAISEGLMSLRENQKREEN